MKKRRKKAKKDILQYEHRDKERLNNPPVGLVSSDTDKYSCNKVYSYDPHLDPHLVWASKAEHISFETPNVSLHVHERIDPKTIIQAARKKHVQQAYQASLFESATENPPLHEAIEFYKHRHNWTNRLIAGDSLLVMNSFLEKEGMAGKVQMVYIDPPYGIKYGSNFQPFVNNRNVKNGKDEDLTVEPETIKAFRDTWELGIHSYLNYLRDRLLLVRELLAEDGSCFIQMNDENLHHVREAMDEIFEAKNFIAIIAFKTATSQNAKRIQRLYDYVLWYGKSSEIKFRDIYRERTQEEIINTFNYVDARTHKRYKAAQIDHYSKEERRRLRQLKRMTPDSAYGMRYEDDFAYTKYDNVWQGTIISTFSKEKKYAVQTSTEVIKRCLLMTTDPGDLVLDITCGSGTTAFVAEQWGRRWITCDTSRVAITLAKQRLMTAMFDYYELARPVEGVGSGFNYKTAPHVTLKSIAKNEPPTQEILYDQPIVDKTRARVTGPFTVEAVPAPTVRSLLEVESAEAADESVARRGDTLRQAEWRDELFRTGIRAKGDQKIQFSRLETMAGTRWLHVDGETKEKEPKRIVVSFGPEHAPLEQKQVELALEEARTLVPKPKLLAFAAFQYDPEASKDIDETNWPGVTLLKAQMNADLLTDDLKKERTSNESFWLMGQPDVLVKKQRDDKFIVKVLGFDYYNTRTGTIESGGAERIAMWMLDVDYDGRSLYPRQVFFPMAGKNEGWAKLAKSLRSEIDEELIEKYRGVTSLPFEAGEHKRIGIKIIDDRGIESLRIVNLE